MCVTSFAIFIFAKSRRKSGLIAFKIISILFVEFLTKFNLQLPVIGRLMCYKDKQGWKCVRDKFGKIPTTSFHFGVTDKFL
jgi:hypothetical protein